ncbi:hypothetical protein [Companilactobacillus nantensis]|uniref:hypothetical protein n=1 Tax=Companilactobacillus nantensis TaxID=305793 RepID=UPI00070AB004|nr:hypothetical protein [Companilactobacillus nantensis]GEO63277.1 hypothetical protein LNA01_04600 [Companilactobacillus nantensis]
MKKILTLFLLSSIIFTLVGCTNSTANNSETYYTEAKKSQIQKNKQQWQNKVTNSEVHTLGKYIETLPKNDIPTASLVKGEGTIIKATVLNLQEASQTITPTTKIIIHVDKVLTGNNKLAGKNVKYFTAGGLIPKNNYMSPDSQEPQFKDVTVFEKRLAYPIPNVGKHIIINLKPSKLDFGGRKDKLKQYVPVNVEQEYWIFDKSAKRYQLNNQLITNGEYQKFPKLMKLTNEINQI